MIAFLILAALIGAGLNAAHARAVRRDIEVNPHVLAHRLEQRKLDDAREQRLLGSGER